MCSKLALQTATVISSTDLKWTDLSVGPAENFIGHAADDLSMWPQRWPPWLTHFQIAFTNINILSRWKADSAFCPQAYKKKKKVSLHVFWSTHTCNKHFCSCVPTPVQSLTAFWASGSPHSLGFISEVCEKSLKDVHRCLQRKHML